eukprot:m.107124 g.107124  ORF g.107124 m.107124 type:complete len:63 (+) comp15830_c2_seq1:129-317(+)
MRYKNTHTNKKTNTDKSPSRLNTTHNTNTIQHNQHLSYTHTPARQTQSAGKRPTRPSKKPQM